MRHEKIFKREDGTQIKIVVHTHFTDWPHNEANWLVHVYRRAKRKRLWTNVADELSDFTLRRPSLTERNRLLTKKKLEIVSISEIQQVVDELIVKIRVVTEESIT